MEHNGHNDPHYVPPNRAGELNAVMWSVTAVSSIFVSLRIYCKLRERRPLWWDDYLLVAAWLCETVAKAIMTYQTSIGIGKHIWDISPANISRVGYFAQFSSTFGVLGLLGSKMSFGLTMLRLTDGWVRIAVWICIYSMNLFFLALIILTWVRCQPVAKIWSPQIPGFCLDKTVYSSFSIAASAYSGVLDLALTLIPWTVIPKLQMRVAEKCGILVAMSLGIFTAIAAFLKAVYLAELSSNDFTWGIVDYLIWGTVEVGMTMVATSVPVLRPLISKMITSIGGTDITMPNKKSTTETGKQGYQNMSDDAPLRRQDE